ncbi:MAG: hypothetical protein CME20_17065 [Gemmatimonadetes bacterium]|nr:hypothetical protein [Gemmatimonadota bacterium]
MSLPHNMYLNQMTSSTVGRLGKCLRGQSPRACNQRANSAARQRDIGPRVFGRPVFLSIAPQHQGEQAVSFRLFRIAGQECTAGGNHFCVLPALTVNFG